MSLAFTLPKALGMLVCIGRVTFLSQLYRSHCVEPGFSYNLTTATFYLGSENNVVDLGIGILKESPTIMDSVNLSFFPNRQHKPPKK